MNINPKMNIADMKVSYTPGKGYTGYIPGCSVTMRWGNEFIAQKKEQAAQKIANADTMAATIAPRAELTHSDIAELAQKYNPNKMTQTEYDSFLDDLVDMGALRKDEIGQLGYHGCVVVGSLAEGGFGFGVGCYQLDAESISRIPYGFAMSLSDTNGDALAYAKLMALWKPCSGSAGFLTFAEKGNTGFTALAGILEAIQNHHKS